MKYLIRYISLILLALFVINGVKGQNTIDIRTSQKINLEALKLVEKYQFLYDMRKGRDYDNFIDVFVSPESKVCNDIMPDNNLNKMVAINEYLNLFDEYYKKPINVKVIPFELSSIRVHGTNKGELSVYCHKIMSGNTKKQINYVDTFLIEIIVNYDLIKDNYKINTVLLSENKGQYFVLEANLKIIFGNDSIMRSDTLIINVNVVGLNTKGQYVIKNINYLNSFVNESTNEDIIGINTVNKNTVENYSKSENGDKNTKKLYFKQPFFYSELSVAVNPFGLPVVKYVGEQQISSGENKVSYNIGVNIAMLITPKYRLYIKVGGHYKELNYIINQNRHVYSTEEIDPDNYNYLRTNDIQNIVEESSINYLVVPFGIHKIFKFQKFQINFELGAMWHYALSSKSSSNADAIYSGYYKDLFGIEIAENGVYDFGNYKLEYDRELDPVENMFSAYSLLGVGYRLNKRTTLNFDFIYNHGFDYIFEENVIELSGTKEELNSITNVSNEFVLRETCLNINLKYKF